MVAIVLIYDNVVIDYSHASIAPAEIIAINAAENTALGSLLTGDRVDIDFLALNVTRSPSGVIERHTVPVSIQNVLFRYVYYEPDDDTYTVVFGPYSRIDELKRYGNVCTQEDGSFFIEYSASSRPIVTLSI